MHEAVVVASLAGGLVALGIVCRVLWRFAAFMAMAAETLKELRPNEGGSVKDKVDAVFLWKDRYEAADAEWKRLHTALDESRFGELSVKVDRLGGGG